MNLVLWCLFLGVKVICVILLGNFWIVVIWWFVLVIKKLINYLVILELRVFVGKFLYLILIVNGDDGIGIIKKKKDVKRV